MKVGDYVRIKEGQIAKIIDNIENPYKEKTIFVLDKEINIFDLEGADMYLTLNPLAEETTNKIDTYFGDEKIIVKSSPNIIDLIEVGDYVNGYLVYEVKENCVMVGYKCFKTEFNDEEDFLYQTIYANDIKSIATREMFENIQYEVK